MDAKNSSLLTIVTTFILAFTTARTAKADAILVMTTPNGTNVTTDTFTMGLPQIFSDAKVTAPGPTPFFVGYGIYLNYGTLNVQFDSPVTDAGFDYFYQNTSTIVSFILDNGDSVTPNTIPKTNYVGVEDSKPFTAMTFNFTIPQTTLLTDLKSVHTPAIPEPTSFGAISLVGLAVLVFRRNRT